MDDLQCDPAHEKELLYAAIGTLYEQWGRSAMGQAYSDLHAAIARAERALAVLEPQQNERGIGRVEEMEARAGSLRSVWVNTMQ